MNKLPQDVQHHVRSLESLATMVPAGIAADAIRQAADFVRTQAQSLVESQAGQRHWKANHDNMVSRLRIFTQRQDLPKNLADRLPWYREMVTLQEQVAQLRTDLTNATEQLENGKQLLREEMQRATERGEEVLKLRAQLAAVQQGVQLTNEQIEAIEKQVWDLNHFDEVEREGNRKFAHLIAAATHPTQQGLDATRTTTVVLGAKLFSFSSMQDWISGAQRRWKQARVSADRTICLDQKGRVLQKGLEFMRAEKEGAFPVDVYLALVDDTLRYEAAQAKQGGV